MRVDKTLFIKRFKSKIVIGQIYVDDIVFGLTSQSKLNEFVNQMKNEFKMSIVGELTYFLSLQMKQMNDEIFICQSKYAKNLVKKFGLETFKCLKTPMGINNNGVFIDPTLFRSMIESLLLAIKSHILLQ